MTQPTRILPPVPPRPVPQFWEAVSSDPPDFLKRVGHRFLAATLWYEPFDPAQEARRPWALRFSRLTHPLPFLALLVLVGTSARRPLQRVQWVVIGAYLFYLLPYIGASYYERYAVPLLAAKVLLVLWAVDRLPAFRRAPVTIPPPCLTPQGSASEAAVGPEGITASPSCSAR